MLLHVVKFFVAVAYAGGRGLRDVNPRMTPESVATVDRGLTAKREYHVVPNTNHFAFVTPGPPTLPEPKPEGCTVASQFVLEFDWRGLQ